MKNPQFDNFCNGMSLDTMKQFVWDSVDAIEEFICYDQGWQNAAGKHGTDAYDGDQAIEIKTQSYTGKSQKLVPLNGKFTFSQPSIDTCARISNEEIHIFGKDDITREIVYHISISGKELRPYLVDHVNTKMSKNSSSVSTINWNYNLYENFESLVVHSFDEVHMNAHPERYTSEFIKFLIGDVAFYERFHADEINEYDVVEVVKVKKGKAMVNSLVLKHKVYGITTTQQLSSLKKFNPLHSLRAEIVEKAIKSPVIDIEATYATIVDTMSKTAGSTEGLLTLKSFKSKMQKLSKIKA